MTSALSVVYSTRPQVLLLLGAAAYLFPAAYAGNRFSTGTAVILVIVAFGVARGASWARFAAIGVFSFIAPMSWAAWFNVFAEGDRMLDRNYRPLPMSVLYAGFTIQVAVSIWSIHVLQLSLRRVDDSAGTTRVQA